MNLTKAVTRFLVLNCFIKVFNIKNQKLLMAYASLLTLHELRAKPSSNIRLRDGGGVNHAHQWFA
eukprot:3987213-Pleurochrysis_carterae.AAC.1